jgi:hypothetical protein
MKWEPQTLNYSHEALIRQIMANPTATNAQLGAVFGRTKEWVSMVKSSGLFKEQYAKLAGEVMDPILAATLEDRMEMVAARSLEVLQEKLARPSQDISDELALQAAAFGAKGLGLGGFSSRPAPIQPVPALDRIERLADRLTNLNRPSAPHQEISDAKIINVVPQASEVRAA